MTPMAALPASPPPPRALCTYLPLATTYFVISQACGVKPALPTVICEDGVTTAGVGDCVNDGGVCKWQITYCPVACPLVKCATQCKYGFQVRLHLGFLSLALTWHRTTLTAAPPAPAMSPSSAPPSPALWSTRPPALLTAASSSTTGAALWFVTVSLMHGVDSLRHSVPEW